ncbi:adenylyl-sulfate kinase [Pseudonocardia endophytica]|uniref:adenylyl-sulfate kinase n=1 Tax=Pseudonocardia endophytica TaxID=401976 RepID=UPI001A9FA5B1|nr:adenylyl-sulfate kinase [Pseudonocardia endophytica]
MTSWIPSPVELDDLDLLLHGAYRPLTGFLDADAAAAVVESGTLPDGTPWPVPITLTVPDATADEAVRAGTLTLSDEQRTPVAELAVERADPAGDGRSTLAGPVRGLHPRERADGVRLPDPLGDGPVFGVPMTTPPHAPDVAAIAAAAEATDARVVLLPLVGDGSPDGLDGAGLVRAATGAAAEIGASVVALPLARHDAADGRDNALAGRVAAALGVTHLPDGWGAGAAGTKSVALPEMALDRATKVWTPTARVPAERRDEPAAADVPALVADLIARDEPVPRLLTPLATERELRGRAAATAPVRAGVTVLFTGLSGSGKSTIANAVHAALTERTPRSVTLLDGDVVRTMLSSELGFSREHRELNVRRIGFVAAEVTRHGGVALCAPIAPYASVRAEVRAMVEAHGRFVLVHVSTPLEVCEARDRKGLYAKARRGEIAEFTGISDPYETPTDAELTIDASRVDVAEAVERVLAALERP